MKKEEIALTNSTPAISDPRVAALFAEDVTASSGRAYKCDLLHFIEWCNHHDLNPLPCTPMSLVQFLTEHSEGYAMSTVERRAAAVSWAHKKAGYLGDDNPRLSPLVTEALRLLRRRYKKQGTKQAKELNTEIIREAVKNCTEDPNSVLGLRDATIILIGFAGAFRRSEIVSLTVEDLAWVKQGLEITVRWSKTDQEGRGAVKKIPAGQIPSSCPVKSLEKWLKTAEIEAGPIFRRVFKNGRVGDEALSGQAIYNAIKARMQHIGLENWKDFSPHSMRSGFASVAAENGASLQSIKGQGGWKSDSVAMRYIRNREEWENAAGYKLGL